MVFLIPRNIDLETLKLHRWELFLVTRLLVVPFARWVSPFSLMVVAATLDMSKENHYYCFNDSKHRKRYT